jgi:hypothetical protein
MTKTHFSDILYRESTHVGVVIVHYASENVSIFLRLVIVFDCRIQTEVLTHPGTH